MPTLHRYARIWRALVANSFKTQMSTALGSTGHLIGKLLRLFFFLFYILAIFKHVPGLKGYSMWEVVLFFMTFNIVDVSAQFLFRGMYGVKYLIEEGDFDKILTQPAHPLFRISVMGTDLLDLLTLIPIGCVTVYTINRLPMEISTSSLVLYGLLLANAMLIAYAFHVFVAALSVRTQEMESAIWVYRDIMTLGRFPTNIYADVLRLVFVTAVPIGVMISFPAQALLGLLSWKGILYSFLLGLGFHLCAQWYWRNTLKEYTSISG